MSNTIQAHAWKQTLDCHAKIVYVALADHADDRGICWPGLWGLAEKCSMDRRTVQRKVRELEALGLLRTEPGSGPHGTSLYYLNLSMVIKGKSKPLEGGGDVPPLQQRHAGAARCRPGRQPRHTGGGTAPPESSEENLQKKEKRREEKMEAAAPPPPTSQRVGSSFSDSERASREWILAEWGAIPGVKVPDKLVAGAGTDKAIAITLRKYPLCTWWRELFDVVRASPWLIGECEPAPGRTRFRATLAWILGPKNLAKVLEGEYRPRSGDRPSVRGKFDPRGTLEWVARKEAERAAVDPAGCARRADRAWP